ncbi:DUF3306 domain-containing protein [Ramlibacter sp. WS9]|uniref:DUF3306 domain-containing protein n=1 Tax=Ramlibacter sp. WS9 TaxID=1882741 RepID=UPI0011413302|nr:DUF3306 domain-containing protein [Ramlibacter sp. WS9]ROZ72111.1 DUF3306 domain-containing protein [Ramlibacter sp. WS9]
MTDGFLGRWSKRKLDVNEGRAVEPEPPSVIPAEAGIQSALDPRLRGDDEVKEESPPPTLEDVQALTADSDFKRFVTADVPADVKNAAVKKLFADPRYNVMDGLDVYIDDYSKPDPIPYSMLRGLASAKFLGLFDAEEKEEAAAREAAAVTAEGPRDVADNPTAQTVAQSAEAPPAVPEPPQHADPDLRLQQDHAAAGEDPGRGAG